MVASEPINSIESIASDMELPHEARLHGVPDYYSWASGSEVAMGNDPGNFTAITAYGTVNADAAGNSATNTRFQIRNIKTYVLSKKNGTWRLVQSSVGVEGAAFREDFAGNVNVPANVRQEADGSISVKLTPGYNYHFWPKGGRATIDPNDIGGVFTTVDAQLIVDNPTQPDDRDQARILMSMGGDYWLDTLAGWDNGKTHGSIGGGRFRYIDSTWDTFNMHTLTRDKIYSKPPPIPLADLPLGKSINGTAGNDNLIGTAANDTILTGAGNDNLTGNAGSDLLTTGTGIDRILYRGATQEAAFAGSRLNNLDRITDLNVTAGDRIQIDSDSNLATAQRPTGLFNAGQVTGAGLATATRSAYADKDQKQAGKQSLNANEAILFDWKGGTYAAVNDGTKAFDPGSDLLINVTGLIRPTADASAGVLTVTNYFQ